VILHLLEHLPDIGKAKLAGVMLFERVQMAAPIISSRLMAFGSP
jgi:hypothetical protein